MNSWIPCHLGELVDIKHGWPFKSDQFSEALTGRPIVVSVGNFRYTGGFRFQETSVKEYRATYPAEYELKAGDILLVMTCQTAGGEILGIPARVPDDSYVYLHNQRLGKVVVRDPRRSDPDFLYWLFLSKAFNRELVTSASGTKILHTAPSRIKAFRFNLPPIEEQRAIAKILGTLNDKIELNRRMSETLEGIARALFKSWFVDFDPVRAKAEGRETGLPKEIEELFPDRLVESEMGEVPEGWDVKPIGDLVTVLGGGTPSTKNPEFWDDGVHSFCTPRDMAGLESVVLTNTSRHLTPAGVAKVSSGQLPSGTVLLSSRAPIGYLAIADVPVTINQGIIAMVCETGVSNLYTLFWAREFMDVIKAHANGSTFQEISKANFRRLLVTIPPMDVMRHFDRLTRSIYRRISGCVRESHTLAACRDLLLPELLSGRCRVPNVCKEFD